MKKDSPDIFAGLDKSRAGVEGLNGIAGGGLPAGRATPIRRAAGLGSTILALEVLARGARRLGEPGVFMMFEENAAEFTVNVRSLGFDLAAHQAETEEVYFKITRETLLETNAPRNSDAMAPLRGGAAAINGGGKDTH